MITLNDMKEVVQVIEGIEEQIQILDSHKRIMAETIMKLSERVKALEIYNEIDNHLKKSNEDGR
ncbi:MAG: hypothetical protein K0U52_11295 [Gammaproteobacteria bacterium]|nr:hypothetical protein [Gammaproteobacteria bacterium]